MQLQQLLVLHAAPGGTAAPAAAPAVVAPAVVAAAAPGAAAAAACHVYSLNPAGLQGIDPSGLEHFLAGD